MFPYKPHPWDLVLVSRNYINIQANSIRENELKQINVN